MIALEAASAPESAVRWLDANPRREAAILDHGFVLDISWWARRFEERAMDDGPLATVEGVIEGSGTINRRVLFDLAEDAVDDESGEGALRLLWPVLLWGTGNGNRLNRKRIDAVARDRQRVARTLRDAARVSRLDPGAAFSLLSSRATRVPYLGPGFATKFLYFAGGGAAEHPSAIVDSRVLKTLFPDGSELHSWHPKRMSYGKHTYLDALSLMNRWALELSSSARRVSIDEIERWAFDAKLTSDSP